MKKSSIKGSLLLILAAFIWGVAFVAQSVAMDHMDAFTFNGIRSLLGGIVLLPLVAGRVRKAKETVRTDEERKKAIRTTLTGGVCCGLALCCASMFQQIGIGYTSVANAGFITALYMLIVPILGLLFHKRVRVVVWVGVGLAVAGMYFLCIGDTFTINRGDLLVLICAVIFAVHILVIDYFSPKADGVMLSCIQFFVTGIICTVCAFLFETPDWHGIVSGWLPIAYAGIMSCGVAYTLQIVGQKDVEPTIASMILSLESAISALAGWVILGQKLSLKQAGGCVLVFAAIMLVQLPERQKAK